MLVIQKSIHNISINIIIEKYVVNTNKNFKITEENRKDILDHSKDWYLH